MVQWIHAQGVALNVPNNYGNEPIFFACGAGNLAIVQWMHAQGAALDSANDNGNQPIDFARGHEHVIQWLREQGISLFAPVDGRCKSLHLTPSGKACHAVI